MTDIERWLRDGPETGPREPLERTLAATRITAQRPAWRIREWWVSAPQPVSSRTRLWLALATAVLVAAATLAILVGARREPPPALGGNGLIAYSSGDRLMVRDPDGSIRPVGGGLGHDQSAAFSPDGRRIAFWSRVLDDDKLHLIVVDLATGNARDVSGFTDLRSRAAAPPAWSPDSRSIAFSARDDSGGPPVLMVADAEAAGTARVILDGSHAPQAPAWSPDGQWIAFRKAILAGGTMGLGIVRPDGTDSRFLVPGPRGAWSDQRLSLDPPSWLPDSRGLVYGHGAEVQSIKTVDLEGHEVLLTKPSERGRDVVLAPDGARVAYLRGSGPWILELDGGQLRPLPGPGESLCQLWGWSPDGSSILAAESGCTTLVTIDVATGATTRVATIDTLWTPAWQRVAP
jgi:dipeptidyl aminopeptidase/acylaminoacyl peptidase